VVISITVELGVVMVIRLDIEIGKYATNGQEKGCVRGESVTGTAGAFIPCVCLGIFLL
jgi:hypothetical protein